MCVCRGGYPGGDTIGGGLPAAGRYMYIYISLSVSVSVSLSLYLSLSLSPSLSLSFCLSLSQIKNLVVMRNQVFGILGAV